MLKGFITESDLLAIEEAFPGIWRFYLELHEKPCTFLELVWSFLRQRERDLSAGRVPLASSRTTPR